MALVWRVGAEQGGTEPHFMNTLPSSMSLSPCLIPPPPHVEPLVISPSPPNQHSSSWISICKISGFLLCPGWQRWFLVAGITSNFTPKLTLNSPCLSHPTIFSSSCISLLSLLHFYLHDFKFMLCPGPWIWFWVASKGKLLEFAAVVAIPRTHCGIAIFIPAKATGHKGVV